MKSIKWYEQCGNGHDVVISSRVRLARNLEDYPFTSKLDNATSKIIAEKVTAALKKTVSDAEVISVNTINGDKNVLVEDHLISPDFCKESDL